MNQTISEPPARTFQGELIVGQDIVPMDLVQRALEQNADPVVLDKFMDLHERWEASKAKRAYAAAIADAKAEFGPIVKTKQVDFINRAGQRTRYKHEELAGVAEAIDTALHKHGLSYRWRTLSDTTGVTVTCIVSHRGGYSEENSLSGAFDISGGKNPIQALGSVVTYLERYTLKAALGLVAEQDDDAQGAEQATPKDEREASKQRYAANYAANTRRDLNRDPIEAPATPRQDPFAVDSPADIHDNAQWHTWAGNYGKLVRAAHTAEEIDKWNEVNIDLLQVFKEHEPALYKQMVDWITVRRTELLRKTPQL